MKPADFDQSIAAVFAPKAVTSASEVPVAVRGVPSESEGTPVRAARSTSTGSREPSTGLVTSRYSGPSAEPGVAGAVTKSAQLLPVDCTRCQA